MAESELKPCPFCGGKAVLSHDYTGLGASYIRCEKCGAESIRFIKSFEIASDDRVKQFWNRRADKCTDRSAPAVDAVLVVRCRECKYRFKNNGHDKSGCPIIDTNIWMDDDDFCSHGERKEGTE